MPNCGIELALEMMKIARQLAAVLLLPVVVTMIVPALILGEGRFFPWGENVPSPWSLILGFLGLGLIGMGVMLLAKTITLFASIGHGTLAPWDPPRHLVVRGVYRHVRNPMISGVLAILLGEAFLFASMPLFLWFAFSLLINMIYIPLIEEPRLMRRFGKEYAHYRQNVPRWIPRRTPWNEIVD